MVRDQMLCIVVPISDAHARKLEHDFTQPQIVAQARSFFETTGCVHFATLALLPLTGAGSDKAASKPGLLLELTVDPKLTTGSVVDTLLHHGLALLAGLFDWDPSQKRASIADLMHRHLSRAQCGYVGLRDRTVVEICDERRLFESARSAVASRLKNAPQSDSRTLAVAAARLIDQSGFEFAKAPSPRSFWRSRRLKPWSRIALIAAVFVVPAVLLVATMLGAFAVPGIAAIAAGSAVLDVRTVFGPAVFGAYDAYSVYVVACVVVALLVLEAIVGAMRLNMLSLTASIVMVAGLFVCIFAVPFIGPGPGFPSNLVAFLGSGVVLSLWGLGVLLFLGSLGIAIFAIFVAALIVVPAYLGSRVLVPVFALMLGVATWLVHLWAVSLVNTPPSFLRHFSPLLALQRAQPSFGLAPIDAVFLFLVLFAMVAFALLRLWWRLVPYLAPLIGRLDRPYLFDVAAAQQCSTRIAQGEGALIARPNHMMSLTDVSGFSPWRRWMLRLFLRIVMFAGETWYTEGSLGTVPGIKFAHWHIVDDGRRLLFCSNFDGGFGGYLDDFISGVSQGINLIWRWTELRQRDGATSNQPSVARARYYPPTWLLAFGGCRHEQWFKAYARDSMVPHLFRFEAYPYTNLDIERATRLRDALSAQRSVVSDDVVMRAVES